jgi:hypothetical protein
MTRTFHRRIKKIETHKVLLVNEALKFMEATTIAEEIKTL